MTLFLYQLIVGLLYLYNSPIDDHHSCSGHLVNVVVDKPLIFWAIDVVPPPFLSIPCRFVVLNCLADMCLPLASISFQSF